MSKTKLEKLIEVHKNDLPIFFDFLTKKTNKDNFNYIKSVKIKKYYSNRVVILPFYKHVSRL